MEGIMKLFITKKRLIKEFAIKIADLQKRSDESYYRDNPPKKNRNEHASWLLDQIIPLKEMCLKLGIFEQVYAEAYKIYDFSNSGKDGYTLKDGKIQKME